MSIFIAKGTLQVGSGQNEACIMIAKGTLQVGSRNYVNTDLTESSYPGLYIDGNQVDEWIDDWKTGDAP